MKTTLECLPCFLSQGLFAARQAGASRAEQKRVMDAVAALIPEIAFDASPPEIAVPVYRRIREITGNPDPFAAVKEQSNRAALAIAPSVRERIANAPDPLLTGVLAAIAGNIIDYGANHKFDLKEEINRILTTAAESAKREETRLFNLESLRSRLGEARNILYLGDNAGEIVFDKLLIETLQGLYPAGRITYAVRHEPIINDVTLEDARSTGLDEVCPVVSSGSRAPGTVPELCSPDFRKRMEEADLIISKGQGNYESLSDTALPLYYLLRVKCPVIAADIPAEMGDICLLKGN